MPYQTLADHVASAKPVEAIAPIGAGGTSPAGPSQAAVERAMLALVEQLGLKRSLREISGTRRLMGGPNFIVVVPLRLYLRPAVSRLLAGNARLRAMALIVGDPRCHGLSLYDLGPFARAALELAARSPDPLARLARGFRNGEDLVYAQMARRHGRRFLPLDQRHDLTALPELAAATVTRLRTVNVLWRGTECRVFAPPLDRLSWWLDAFGPDTGDGIVLTTPRRLARRLEAERAAATEAETSGRLMTAAPALSAAKAPSVWQKGAVVGQLMAMVASVFLKDWFGGDLLFLWTATTFLGLGLMRLQAWGSFLFAPRPPPPLDEASLPRYSVLVALHDEANMLPQLAAALDRFDYPRDRLDIRFLIEADDLATREAADAELQGRPHMCVTLVPPGPVRTKPRALAYGLAYCRGDLVTVYDAEDRPDADQLRKAAAALVAGPRHLACVQASLDIDHVATLLQRQFQIEYACLFHGVLPWLGRNRMPLPLGGTSNHFKLKALCLAGGWDPYNVTEDADLGARLVRLGYSIGTLDSSTRENAPRSVAVWMRQRRRWIKGWMMTWLVHMRHPGRLFVEMGAVNFTVFQFHMAAAVMSPLIHPLWLLLLVAYGSGLMEPPSGTAFGETLLVSAAGMGLALGYGANFLLGWRTLGVIGQRRARRHLLLMPFYWLLVSAAAWLAVWDLLIRPHHWHKTPHEIVSDRAEGPAES